METGSQALTCFYGNQSSSYPTAVGKKGQKVISVKKTNTKKSILVYLISVMVLRVQSQGGQTFCSSTAPLPGVFSNQYHYFSSKPQNLRARKKFRYQLVNVSFPFSFFQNKSKEIKTQGNKVNSPRSHSWFVKSRLVHTSHISHSRQFSNATSIYSQLALSSSQTPTFQSLSVKLLTT